MCVFVGVGRRTWPLIYKEFIGFYFIGPPPPPPLLLTEGNFLCPCEKVHSAKCLFMHTVQIIIMFC